MSRNLTGPIIKLTRLRTLLLLLVLDMLLVIGAAMPVSTSAAGAAKSNLKNGSCGFIKLTNGGSDTYVQTVGVGSDLILGAAISQWCISYPNIGGIRFHHRVDGKSSNEVIAEHYHKGEDVVITQPDGLDGDADRWVFNVDTGREDWTNIVTLKAVLTHNDEANYILYAGVPKSGDWSNWVYICKEGC